MPRMHTGKLRNAPAREKNRHQSRLAKFFSHNVSAWEKSEGQRR